MKDELPQKVKKVECGIINLQNTNEEGSHWTAYYKNKDKKYYFDSYGDAQPPEELVEYLGLKKLLWSEDTFQNWDDPPICGHLSLIILQKISKGEDYEEILENLINFKDNFLKYKRWTT